MKPEVAAQMQVRHKVEVEVILERVMGFENELWLDLFHKIQLRLDTDDCVVQNNTRFWHFFNGEISLRIVSEVIVFYAPYSAEIAAVECILESKDVPDERIIFIVIDFRGSLIHCV